MQDPFKLHPLPPQPAEQEWDDDDALDLDDSIPPTQATSGSLSLEEELTLNQQMLLQYLAQEQLARSFPDAPHLEVLQSAEQCQAALALAAAKLRAHRSDLTAVIEVRDHLPPPPDAAEEEVEPASEIRRLELRRLPILVGRAPNAVQLELKDPEVAPFRGYFFQLGRHLVYCDLGSPGGTMLERSTGGKMQFIVLKGEPSPVIAGDRLVLGDARTHIVVREFKSAGSPATGPVVYGIAPPPQAAPPVEAAPPPPPTDAPAPQRTPAPGPRPAPPPPRASNAALLLAGVIVAVAGLFIGRLTAPQAASPVPASTVSLQPAPEPANDQPHSSSLVIEADGTLKLAAPPLPRGSRFFLLTSTESEDPQPYRHNTPIALGEVLSDQGDVKLLYLPTGLSPGALATAPAVAASPSDPQVAVFLGLAALQQGRWDEAQAALSAVASTPTPPLAALKGLAALALRRNDVDAATRSLRDALKLDADDPEVHILLARTSLRRAESIPSGDTRRHTLEQDARGAYEEAIRQWLLPPGGTFAFNGHELGLSGDDLIREYLRLEARTTASAKEAATTTVTELSAPAAGDNTATAPRSGPEPTPAETSPEADTPAPRPTPPPRAAGHTLVRIPEGPFTMGGGPQDPPDEQGLPGAIRLKSFLIDKYEVSNAQFERVFPDHQARRGLSRGDDDPAVSISWDEAQAYCRAVGMRLPTEAEWEKAARGTNERLYPWGDSAPQPSKLNFRGSNLGRPTPVDSYQEGASPYGALNMAGNVWEWTADWYDPQYYPKAASSNPTGPSSGTRKVIRGGSYADDASDARASNRAVSNPSSSAPKIGFRCARDG